MMGRPRDLRWLGHGCLAMAVLAAGAGDLIWMAIGIILGINFHLAAKINAKIDALALPAFDLANPWPKPKKDLA